MLFICNIILIKKKRRAMREAYWRRIITRAAIMKNGEKNECTGVRTMSSIFAILHEQSQPSIFFFWYRFKRHGERKIQISSVPDIIGFVNQRI